MPHSDEYSMLRSVELRNFLDLKLVKFITNLKSSLKVNIKKNNLNHKYIIKELAKKEIEILLINQKYKEIIQKDFKC